MNQPSASHSQPADLHKTLDRVRIVLSHTSHPGNIGAAARAMKTMGLSCLALVNPKSFPDPEAVSRAVGADDILERAMVCSSLDEALSGCIYAVAASARHRSLGPAPMQARESGPVVLERALEGDVALVFGNESVGLSNEEIQLCQAAVTIPTNPEFSSLNLASAVQILCYECRLALLGVSADGTPSGSRAATPFMSPMAEHGEVEGLIEHFARSMVATGFHNPDQPGRLVAKLRRLFVRSRLERDEVNILRGFLTSVEIPTRHGTKRKE